MTNEFSVLDLYCVECKEYLGNVETFCISSKHHCPSCGIAQDKSVLEALKNFNFVDSLLRWGQYIWISQQQYDSDVECLSSAYKSLRLQCCGNACSIIYRGETSSSTSLKSYTKNQIIKKVHECWTTDLRTATRFALNRNGYVLQLVDCDYQDEILFDVAVLVSVLPESLTNLYSDLQNAESEIVLHKNNSFRHLASKFECKKVGIKNEPS